MNDKAVKAFQDGKTLALWLGGAVYVGVVLLFLAFYQNLMAAQFEGLLQVIARIGAVLVAMNALALPVALHFWTVTKGHKITASLFYAGDIIVMALNVIAAAGMKGDMPQWLQTYTEYAPASIIFVLVSWAVLFITDPGQRALVALSEAMTDAQVSIVRRTAEFVQSDEGTTSIIEPFAARLAAKVFNERSLMGTSRALPQQTDALNMDELVNQVMAKMQGVPLPLVTQADSLEVGQPVPFRKNGHGS